MADKYQQTMIRKSVKVDKKTGKKIQCYSGVLKYKVPNPDYVERAAIDGPDTRTDKQMRREIWKQVKKTFDPNTVRTNTDARKALEDWRAEMEEQAKLDTTSGVKVARTVSELVAQHIDTLEKSQKVDASTVYGYRKLLKYINPVFKDVPVNELEPEQVQNFVNDLIADGYSPSTVRKCFSRIYAAYKDAVKKRKVRFNPLADDVVDLPKFVEPEKNSLDDAGISRLNTFLSIATDTPTNLAIKLALATGMREGEICGLQWRNVDFQTRELRVRTVVGAMGGQTYIKEPKTKNSRREVPLDPESMKMLKQRYNDMLHAYKEAHELTSDTVRLPADYYVFGSIDGDYMKPHYLWQAWRTIAKSIGLVGSEGRVPNFHDLRHTFATSAIKNGADVKSVSSLLGHSNEYITLHTYASADKEAKRRVMEQTNAQMNQLPKQADILALDKTGTEN